MIQIICTIIGSIAREWEGTTYYRCTGLGTDNKLYSFRSKVEPTLEGVAVVDHYPIGSTDWDGNTVERATTICKMISKAGTLRNAKALAAELADITL